jgi:uncharacterized protein (TIGR00251 family)
MSAPWPCLAVRGERTLLAVAVTPNAKRTGADGLHDGALRVRLAAPPVDGKANEALTAWLASELGLPKRAVQVLHGASSRRKQLTLELEEAAVVRWLDSLGITR